MSEKSNLHESLRMLVNTYGHEIYKNDKLINYLNDYCQFYPPALYHIMKTLISDGYASKILEAANNANWTLLIQQYIGKVQKSYGYQSIYVNYCFQSLAFGIGLYPTINQRLLDEVEGKNPRIPENPQTSHTSSPNTTQANTTRNQQQIRNTNQQIQRQGSSQQAPTRRPTPSPTWIPSPPSSKQPGNINIQVGQQAPTSSQSPTPINKGCNSGCFDDMSSIFSFIIFVLWLLIQCT